MSFIEVYHYLSDWNFTSIIVRLVIAMMIGIIVGIDRGVKRKGAGIKTHILVCLGAALVMLTGQFIYMNFEGNMDMSRLGAQVISGVGFLGVGTIIVTGRNQVRGLTTAASLWACACLGLAIGVGFFAGALVMMILFIITLKLIPKLERITYRYTKILDLYLEFDCSKNISNFISQMRTKEIKILDIDITKSKIKGEGPTAFITIEVEKKEDKEQSLEYIRDMACVKYMEEL